MCKNDNIPHSIKHHDQGENKRNWSSLNSDKSEDSCELLNYQFITTIVDFSNRCWSESHNTDGTKLFRKQWQRAKTHQHQLLQSRYSCIGLITHQLYHLQPWKRMPPPRITGSIYLDLYVEGSALSLSLVLVQFYTWKMINIMVKNL